MKKETKMNGNIFDKFQGLPTGKTLAKKENAKWQTALKQISAESKKKTEIEMLCMSDAKEFAQYILSNCTIDKYKSFVAQSIKGVKKGTPITIYDLYYSYLESKL